MWYGVCGVVVGVCHGLSVCVLCRVVGVGRCVGCVLCGVCSILCDVVYGALCVVGGMCWCMRGVWCVV